MSYFIVEDFRLGQDSRKSTLTAAPGTLTTLTNAHITRGGEIEKRKAFVAKYTLPAGTYGLAATASALYVFGSGVDPGVPTGVSYQRLQHPSAEAMAAVKGYDIFKGLLYVSASYADGTIYQFYNASRVTDFVDGQARGSFNITGGTASAGVNKVSSVKVNGVEVLNTAVDWTTSNSATAAAVATQINTYNSTPEYTATSDGNRVIVIAASGSGTTPNGYAISVTVGGDVTVGSIVNMDGGDVAGSLSPGAPVKTFATKMNTVAGSKLAFSAVDDPTTFNDSGIGAGSVDMASESAGSETLTALEIFYDLMAIFSANVVQVWFLEADDENNAKRQVLKNTGTSSGRSVAPFGDGDVFYLAPNGVRALKARDTNNIAQVSEVGTAIDTAIIDYLATLTSTQIANAVAVIEPQDKRYLLAVGSKIFAYSFFAGSKIAAWSTYEPGFEISDFAVLNNRLYARSGNTIYLYGGDDNDQYDSDVTVVLPYIDAQRPATVKGLQAIDIVGEGTWTVQMAANPDRPDDFDDLGTFSGTTLHQLSMAARGRSTYFAFKFTNTGTEYARLSRFIMHFEQEDAKKA